MSAMGLNDVAIAVLWSKLGLRLLVHSPFSCGFNTDSQNFLFPSLIASCVGMYPA